MRQALRHIGAMGSRETSSLQAASGANHRYRHSGLVVQSALALPSWAAFRAAHTETPGAAADITITLADDADPDPALFEETAFAAGTLRFSIENVGEWAISGGNRIAVTPAPGVLAEELALFTTGSAWGALGYQRGLAMWHGSAVRRGGRTVLFCGDAGEGKSTMAAAMIAGGATLVSDDLSRIDSTVDGALIHPSSDRVKLWHEAIAHLGLENETLTRDHMRQDKFLCPVRRHDVAERPRRLTDIVVLETGAMLGAEPLSGAKAIEAVLRATIYRPEMIEAMGLWPQQGALAAQIVSRCRVARLTRPRDLNGLDQAAKLAKGFLEA